MEGMATKQEMQNRLNDINALLQAGTKKVTIDGVTIDLDFDALKTERSLLERNLGRRTRKPVFYGVNLGG